MSQQVVYDNTAVYQRFGMPMLRPDKHDSAEMGDEVVLSGKSREVVALKLRFWYYGKNTASFDMRLRFRDLDPAKPTPGPPKIVDGRGEGFLLVSSPSNAFYEGPLQADLKAEPGMNEYTIEVPHVKVPDRFVWTVQLYKGKDLAECFGLAYYNSPTVGSSDDYFWHSDAGSPWIAYTWGAEPVCNFGARILAVGE